MTAPICFKPAYKADGKPYPFSNVVICGNQFSLAYSYTCGILIDKSTNGSYISNIIIGNNEFNYWTNGCVAIRSSGGAYMSINPNSINGAASNIAVELLDSTNNVYLYD